jgi:CBS domain-containing protein
MTTVQDCIQNKANTIYSVCSTDFIEAALKLMRDNRVRAILVIDNGRLSGIVSQGDCAIKVLLPKKDPQTTPVSEVMTPAPLTVTPENTLDECMAIMVHKHIRHLPVVEKNTVKGIVSVGDVVKNIMEAQGSHIKFLETYIRGHGSQ